MKTKKVSQEKQPMQYWLVQFTLTSGRIVEFYVSAINEFEAEEKAIGYQYIVEIPKLLSKLEKFRLLA
jgi:hypothetical protein